VAYKERDDLVKRLGFNSYQHYLNSSLWNNIVTRAYKEHGKVCIICGDNAQVLHHKNYKWEVMSGKTVKGLVPLCHTCHYGIEFSNKGKRRLDQVNNLLARLTGGGTPPSTPKYKPHKTRCQSLLPKSKRGRSISHKHLCKQGHRHTLICSSCSYRYQSRYRTKYAVCPSCGSTGQSSVYRTKRQRSKANRKKMEKPPHISQARRKEIVADILSNPRF
jgi:hypothetical protein